MKRKWLVIFFLSQSKAPVETLKPVPLRPPSSADSTSGYFSSGASYVDDQAGKYLVFSIMEVYKGRILLSQ